jgi:uncharacterized protein
VAEPTVPSIAVTGTGTASAPADLCIIRLRAEAVSARVDDALAAASTGMERMLGMCRRVGCADRDLQTSGVQVWPRYSNNMVTGYTAGLGLTVRVRRVEEAGRVLAAVVESGGDTARVQDVRFEHDDPRALEQQARERAWADARAKADQLASLGGVALGPVLQVDEHGGGVPVPRAFALAAGGAARMADVPVEAGETEVSVGVQVRWALA